MKQELSYKIPEQFDDYLELAQDMVGKKGIFIQRTEEMIYYFDVSELTKKINHLLDLEVWGKFEILFLESLKDYLKKGPLIHLKKGDAMRIVNLALESCIERMGIVRQELITDSFKNYNETLAKSILALDGNIKLLRGIKQTFFVNKSQHEILELLDNVMTIFKNIIFIYSVLTKNVESYILDQVIENTSKIWIKNFPIQILS